MKNPKTPEETIAYLAEAFHLDNVSCLSWGIKASGFALFTANMGQDKVFIKWGGKPGCCLNDYTYTRRLYEKSPEFFLQPYFFRNEGEIQCFGMECFEGRTLKNSFDNNSLTDAEKENLISKLPLIAQALIDANCVHRDIKPDNFALLPNGGIKLFDFEFATNAHGYKEREEILRCPDLISCVGTKSECGVPLGVGRFIWDDMFVFGQILKRIGSSAQYAEAYAKSEDFFRKEEGKRVLRLPGRINFIVKRRLFKTLASLVPVKSWRNKLREQYKKPLN